MTTATKLRMSSLTIPDDPGEDVVTAACRYTAAGLYVLPIRLGKHLGSVVGTGWPSKSTNDPTVITAHLAGTDYGIALHAGRSGLVVLDVDHPDLLPDWLAEILADPAVPFQSTRDGDPRRGHYVFAMPPGRNIGNPDFPGGEVRGANGGIVLGPSRHAKAGESGRYVWKRTGQVPFLPPVLAELWTDSHSTDDAVSDGEAMDFIENHPGPGSNRGAFRIGPMALYRKRSATGARHPALVAALVWACREILAGMYGTEVLMQLRDEHRAMLADPTHPNGADPDRNDWSGALAWSIGQARAKPAVDGFRAHAAPARRLTTEELFARAAEPVPVRPATTGRTGPVSTAPPEVPATGTDPPAARSVPAPPAPDDGRPSVTLATVHPIRPDVGPTPAEEETFWMARPVLAHVRTYATARHANPWAVLGCLLPRVAMTVPPFVVLPAIIGGCAAVNPFTALVGRSGGGKGIAERVAAAAVVLRVLDHAGNELDASFPTAPIGSGEGVSRSFATRAKDDDDEAVSGVRWQHRAVLFTASEVDGLAALTVRNGATLPEQLRKLAMGESLGFGYADPVKRVILPEHSYRAGLVIGVQPERAAPLLSDAESAGGTPQRFLWMPTGIERPAVLPALPPPWRLPAIPWTGTGHDLVTGLPMRDEINVPDAVVSEVIDWHYRRHDPAEVVDPLDAHAMLTRLRVAFLLAVLDGRKAIGADDWTLSGTIMRKSDATRNGIRRVLAEANRRENRNRGRAEGERAVAAAEVVDDAIVKRIAGAFGRKIRAAGAAGIGHRELTRPIGRRQERAVVPDAIDRLLATGSVRRDGDPGARGVRYVWTGDA